MPVISPTRYSTAGSSSSYLPPSIGGTTSSLTKSSSGYGTTSSYHSSNYRSNSLGSSSYSSGTYSGVSSYLPRSSYRSSLSGTSSIYRTGSYLTGGNNDSTAANRFGVSSNRLSHERDTLRRVTGKTQYNNNTINTTSRSKALQTKPPIGASSSSIRHQRTASDIIRSRDNSLTRVTSKSDPNSNCISNNDTSNLTDQPKNKISSSLSSSSLARQVATSGLELYEKYSPAHYIPNRELSRSRSLSEATSSSNKINNFDSGLSNSSSNVHQLLQSAKETRQQKQQNLNENELQNLNLKSSSPTSSSHQTSSPTSAKDISKVKKLCAVSTTATNNFSKFATGSVVVNSNNKIDLNANALPSYTNRNSLDSGNCPKIPPHNLDIDSPLAFVSSNNLINHPHNVDITHTTNSISSLKPFIKGSIFNLVTNNKSSEHDNNKSSKHSNNINVTKSATTIQSEQQKSISSFASKSAIHSVNNNSASSHIVCKNFQKPTPTVATSASSTSALSSKPIATTTFQTITSTILSSSATPPAPPAATTVATTNSSSSQKIVSKDASDKYSATNNANAILKAVKSNLKPTSKIFLTDKLADDKTMTSLYTEVNGNCKNNNLNNNTNNNKGGSTILTVNSSTTSTSATSLPSPRRETVVGKTRSLLKSGTDALDVHLEFCKSKLYPPEVGKVKNTSAVHGTASAGKSKFIGLTYREPNFLKIECELARSQVAKSSEHSLLENNNLILNGNKNCLAYNAFEKGNNKYDKNLIKPLVHKSTTSKNQLSRAPSNNNMNCLQNGGGPDLDDIKFIDSDDSERQHHNGHTYHNLHQNQKRSTTSNSKTNTIPETAPSTYSSPSRTLSERKDISYSSSSKLSTLPLPSKHHRDLLYSSDSIKSVTTKYNTLNDFKRIPTNTNSGVRSGLHRNADLISSSSSPSSSPPSSTTTPVKTFTTSTSALAKSSVVMIHHQNGTTSHESTPSSSPKTLRRKNPAAIITNNIHHTSSDSPSSPAFSSKAISHLQQPQLSGVSTVSSPHSQPSASVTSANVDEKIPNKICDNDESARNASLRSALPPSPTPSRYWEREGRSSALAAGRSYETEDNSTTKSSISTSNSYDKTAAEGLCGLRNIGNTCYMNSVIQCLSHTRELTKFLKTQTSAKSSTKDQQILLEFAKLIREMWSPNVRSVTPLELKSAFSSKHRMYSGYNQQDAQEFLRFFLDSLHCALNTGTKGEPLKIDESLSDNKKADLTWDWYCKIENSVIRDLFLGQLKSTLKCTTCGNTSVTFDPFWDLSVPLQSSSRCKLDSCLELFIREEVLDGDEMPTCSKCQARRKCTKTFTIQRFPKYLVIHLKRFSETRWSKMSNVVEFPTGERELNMAPYASNNVSATYSLYGIANHMGSTAGGHYVALCKHPVTKKWHEFNDNVVSDDLSESVLVSSSAYLLFYERA